MSKETIPEMMNEGQRNTLAFLQSNPNPEEVRRMLPLIEALSLKPSEEALEDLTEKEKNKLLKELAASNYLLSLAMRLLGEERGEKKPLNVQTSKAGAFVTTVDKVSRNTFLYNEASNKEMLIAMEKRGNKKEITTKVVLNINDLEGVTLNKELTPYDREVHDAVISLYVAGNEVMSVDMIYRVMTGKDNAVAEPKAKKEINQALKKMRFTEIRIEAKEEIAYYKKCKPVYKGYLIPAEEVENVSMKGNVTDFAIRVIKKPVLLEYSDAKDQIGRVDIKLLDTPINKNSETIVLQGYLFREILRMKSPKQSKTILYESVYEYLKLNYFGSEAALKNKKVKIRNFCKAILDFWKQNGFIKNYAERKKGTTYYSLDISL